MHYNGTFLSLDACECVVGKKRKPAPDVRHLWKSDISNRIFFELLNSEIIRSRKTAVQIHLNLYQIEKFTLYCYWFGWKKKFLLFFGRKECFQIWSVFDQLWICLNATKIDWVKCPNLAVVCVNTCALYRFCLHLLPDRNVLWLQIENIYTLCWIETKALKLLVIQ